ncbi:putative G10 protein [Ordospora colligata]|uniref:Putative G10 protein n=1 Tax=Ordospora colligata OC4 TaxID=1354746 RepID=A0A0B2UKD9_9MICR|nr:putative G10 protein [Ordospora colligata OC4]KHN69778.1 putative G10 protein [Ordospora colligata OC4]TBU15581.1 putative G10 protein [Ordospora colligata]TBU15648.1 putative G10 protein [Ordospora colligata]TBU18699.1 putative G10 protein [Ordospora colligata]
MPRIPINPPAEFEKVRDFLEKVEAEMRRLENAPLAPRNQENFWPIFQLHHQRTRHICNLYDNGEISKELYKYLVENMFVDHSLACYWKKMGYENLCCVRCIQPIDSKHGNVCVCRVPQRSINAGQVVRCDNCGCMGCSGY